MVRICGVSAIGNNLRKGIGRLSVCVIYFEARLFVPVRDIQVAVIYRYLAHLHTGCRRRNRLESVVTFLWIGRFQKLPAGPLSTNKARGRDNIKVAVVSEDVPEGLIIQSPHKGVRILGPRIKSPPVA